MRLASQCQLLDMLVPLVAGDTWPDMSSLFQVVKACNEGVRKMSRTEQMISIQKKMEFKIKVSLQDLGQPVPSHDSHTLPRSVGGPA